jgi:hypothetical protein
MGVKIRRKQPRVCQECINESLVKQAVDEGLETWNSHIERK